MSRRPLRFLSVSAVLLNSLLGLVLLTSGCGGGDQAGGELSPANKQNIQDEMNVPKQEEQAATPTA